MKLDGVEQLSTGEAPLVFLDTFLKEPF